MTLSPAPTSKAGVLSNLPLTLTRPSAIQRSASRREQNPARAIAFAMRMGPSCLSAVSVASGLDMNGGTFDMQCELMTSSGAGSYMSLALDEARAAAAHGDVPVGAVIVSPSGAV